MSHSLDCADLTIAYAKAEPVVHDVSLSFAPGVWAVVGPNGAGKSTLLRTLSGLHRPLRGRVELDGEDLHTMSAKRRASSVAYVAQRSSVWAGFDVRTIVSMGRYALPRDDDAVERALERVGLRERADDEYRALSVGQQQRVMFARAMAQLDGSEHGVLIADEPLSAQDPSHVASVVALMRERAGAGGVVVCALHDTTTALRCADHAVLLGCDGRVVQAGRAIDALSPGLLERVFGVGFDLVRAPGGPALLPRGTARPPNGT